MMEQLRRGMPIRTKHNYVAPLLKKIQNIHVVKCCMYNDSTVIHYVAKSFISDNKVHIKPVKR